MSPKFWVADDSDIVRLLKEEPSIEVVGEAKGFAQTIQLTGSLKPDLSLMDLHMSDENEYLPELANPKSPRMLAAF